MEETKDFWQKFLCEGIFHFLNGLSTLEIIVICSFLTTIIIFIAYLVFKAYIIQKDVSSKELAMNTFIEKIAEKENKIKRLERKIKELSDKISY